MNKSESVGYHKATFNKHTVTLSKDAYNQLLLSEIRTWEIFADAQDLREDGIKTENIRRELEIMRQRMYSISDELRPSRCTLKLKNYS